MKTFAILLIAVFGLANGTFLLDEEFPNARLFPYLMEDDYEEKRTTSKVDSSVLDFYNDMLSTRNKYAILKINDEKKVVIDSQGQSDDTATEEDDEKEFNKMKNALPANEARYILYKFSFFSKARQMAVKKVVFIIWANSQAKNSEALEYKTESKKVKKELGLSYSMQFSSDNLFTYPKMVQRVQWL